MQLLHNIAGIKTVKSLAAVLLAAVVGSMAQAQQTGGPSRSSPGAEVYFIDLKEDRKSVV